MRKNICNKKGVISQNSPEARNVKLLAETCWPFSLWYLISFSFIFTLWDTLPFGGWGIPAGGAWLCAPFLWFLSSSCSPAKEIMKDVYMHSRNQVTHVICGDLVTVNLHIQRQQSVIRFLPYPQTLFWKHGSLILTVFFSSNKRSDR